MHLLATAMLALLAIAIAAHAADAPAPRLLAPGVISTSDDEWGFSMSPQGDALWFNKADRGYRIQVIMESSKDAHGRWQSPRVAAFSGQYRDIDPALSPDGRYLVFASNRPVQAGGARRADFDLWRVDRLAGGGWSPPRHLGDAVNGPGSETNSSVAANGTLYFAVSEAQGRRDLMRARATPDGYAMREPLPAPINSDADESNHWIAPDESYLLFLSNRPGGLGENDLYISFRDGDGWHAPRNLGAPVNRPGASGVFTPFVDAEGRHLYFAERRSTLDPLPERALDAAALEAYLRGPGNGQGDLHVMPWSAEAYR